MKLLRARPGLVFCLTFVSIVAAASVVGDEPTESAQLSLPPPAEHQVRFASDIRPVFEASCIKCHARGKAKGGFSLEDRAAMLKGGDSGPAVVLGGSDESKLIHLVAGVDPENVMPQKGSRLTPEEVGLLRTWIDQGAPWEDGIAFAKPPPVNLAPREPELPSNTGKTHPIDAFLRPYFEAQNFTPPDVVDDRFFLRRVYLDILGLLPGPEAVEQFIADNRPDKRAQLVRKLLSDRRNYTEHWLTFWNDALRNDYAGTGFIDNGRKPITTWLYSALYENLPYDQFVGELINPTSKSEGFIKGIIWRGVVNASQRPEMQAAQNISQVFLGEKLKCASCHDSFVDDWTLDDAYGLAGIYSEDPLEIFQCDKPTGRQAEPRFLFPKIGSIDPDAPRTERLEQLEEILTSESNGRLSRMVVNRLWQRFFGRGLVEPVDEMSRTAWHQDLLDWLASDFVAHGYDLKWTIERILTSQAYQLPSVGATDETHQAEYQFRGPIVRRLSAEQFLDAFGTVGGVWNQEPADRIKCAELPGTWSVSPDDLPVQVAWIWSDPGATDQTEPGTVYFRRSLTLDSTPSEAVALITCDNSFELWINGVQAATAKDFKKPKTVDLLQHLRIGENVFAIKAVNGEAGGTEGETVGNPAGLWFYARIRADGTDGKAICHDLASNETWLFQRTEPAQWTEAGIPRSGWTHAYEVGSSDTAPWNLLPALTEQLSRLHMFNRVRASLVTADPLSTALGRPIREQVHLTRLTAATTLQALELTNGESLASVLKDASGKLSAEASTATPDLVSEIWRRALGRTPTPKETRLANALVGEPVTQSGIEDLLWAVAMLPEFQLIY